MYPLVLLMCTLLCPSCVPFYTLHMYPFVPLIFWSCSETDINTQCTVFCAEVSTEYEQYSNTLKLVFPKRR
jgi:hypothetical protein